MRQSKPDWTKAPDGATHYNSRDPEFPWLRINDEGAMVLGLFWEVDRIQ